MTLKRLLNKIIQAVEKDRVVILDHADERLRERRIMVWQVLSGVAHGKLIQEHPRSLPFPRVELEQTLADGTPVKTIWSWDRTNRVARLVTVHFLDR